VRHLPTRTRTPALKPGKGVVSPFLETRREISILFATMARDHLFILFTLVVPQIVLGDSFSLPLAKKTYSDLSLPLRRHRGIAQAGEINDQVGNPLCPNSSKVY
jgi:hypothetical protein